MRNSTAALLMAGFLWPLAILFLYYLNHKPITPEIALNFTVFIWRLVSTALLVGLGGGIGFRITRLAGLQPLAALSLQAALGLGIMAAGFFLLGSTIGLPAWLPWVAALLLAALFLKPMLAWLRQWRSLGDLWLESCAFGRAIGTLLAAGLFFTLLIALAPPLKYDSLVYHLTLPEAYLQHGRVSYLPWLVMSGYPQAAEMLYTWALGLGSLQSAAVLGWYFSLLAVVGLTGYLSQKLGAHDAWAGPAALLAGFTLLASTAWAYVDWLGLFFGFGCLVALDRWREGNQPGHLYLAGIFAGFASSTKYTAVILGLAALFVIAWQAWKQQLPIILLVLRFTLPATAIFLPWLVKNGLSTGNPLYPFFFPAGEMDPIRMSVTHFNPPVGNWLDFFLLPVRATITGMLIYDSSIGPLMLMLSAFSWLGFKNLTPHQKSSLQSAAILSAAGLLFWAVGNRLTGQLIQTRFYLLFFPAFAILAAYGFAAAKKIALPQVRLGRILNVIILLVLSLNIIEVATHSLELGAPQAALGLQDEQTYLAENLGWYQPAMQAIRDLPAGSQVMLVYESRGLYCLPVCDPDEILDRWNHALATNQEFDKILETWNNEGFSHLLLFRSGVEFFKVDNDPNHPVSNLTKLDAFLAELPAPVSFGEAYELYSLANRR